MSHPAPTRPRPGPPPSSLQQVLAQLEAVKRQQAADRKTIQGKLAHIDKRVEGLDKLSEAVSLRYNPFTAEAEDGIFDDDVRRDDAGELKRKADARTRPVNAPGEGPPAEGGPGDHGPSGRDGSGRDDGPPIAADLVVDNPFRGRVAPPVPASREAFQVLRWFHALAERAPPPAIHCFLYYYRSVGWLDHAQYEWLSRIAMGVVKPPKAAGFQQFDLAPAALIELHQANLRFLERLFRGPLLDEEASALITPVQRLFQEVP